MKKSLLVSVLFLLALVGSGTFGVPEAKALGGSITVLSVSFSLFNDADFNNIVNPGDTVRVIASINNSDGGCVVAGSFASVDLSEFGSGGPQAMACTDNGGISDLLSIDWLVADGGIFAIDQTIPPAIITVSPNIGDADDAPAPFPTNALGTPPDGATAGVDTDVPTIGAGSIGINTAGCTGTASACIIGNIPIITYNAALDGNTDLVNVTADLSGFGGSTTQPMYDDGLTGGDAIPGDGVFTYAQTVLADDDEGVQTCSVTATDDANNTGGPTTSAASATVDNVAPTFTVLAGTVPIYEGDLIEEFTIQYSESMDNTTTPTGVFTTSANFGAPGGVWSTTAFVDDTYTVTVTHNGNPENVLPETYTVGPASGATDLAGNADTTNFVNFGIDTADPVPTITSAPPLTNGTQTIEFTATDIGGTGVFSTTCSVDSATFTACSSGDAYSTFGGWGAIGDVLFTLTLRVTDNAGNSADATAAATKDTASPYASNVTSPAVNGTFGIGNSLDIWVIFSEALDVTGGTPTIELETGAINQTVPLSGGSGTTTLVFTYTVQEGDTSPDLDYAATDSLALAGATMKDAAGNDATLTLPVPGLVNSLSWNKSYDIDGVRSTVLSSTASVDPITDGGLNQTVVVVYDSTMDNTDDPTITVSGLTSSPYNFVGGAWSATNILDDTYTVSQLLNDDDETGTGTVNVSGASEASSGNIAASDSSATFAVDTTNPTILSSTASVDPITDGGLNQTVVVVYDSTMDNTDDPTITVSGLTSSPYNFVGGAWSATNILDDTYTVSQLLNDDDETGTGTVNVSGASEASSGNIAASDSSATFAVDTTNPTILSSTASVDPITDGGLNQTVVVVYDSTMDNTDDPTITVSGLTSSPYNFVGGAWSATNILDDTYTVSQLLNDDDETGTGTVNVSGASEASSGNIAASDSSATFAVDTTNPTILSSTASVDPITDGGLNQTVVVVYDSTMDNTDDPTITVSGLTSSPYNFVGGAWSATNILDDTYTVSQLLNDDDETGTGTVNVSGASEASSGNIAASDSSATFAVDTTNPTILSSTASVDPITDGGLNQTVVVVYDSTMDNTDDPTITVSGLTSSPYNFVGGAWSATNILDDTYTVSQLLNDDDETGTGTVNVSGASEASSGNIAASDSSATFAVDTTNPTILSSTASVDPITDGGLNQTVVVVYDSTMDNTDDPTITVSGLTSSPYNFVGGAWSATNILDDTYTVSQLLNDDDETGTGTVNVSGASEASSGNIAASDSSATFAVDTTNPTILSSTASVDPITDGGLNQTVVVVYDSTMDNTDDPTITVSGLTSSPYNFVGGAWSATNILDDTYTVSQLLNDDDETGTGTVNVSGASEASSGNIAASDSSATFAVDTTNPTILSSTASVDPITDGGLNQTVVVVYDSTMDNTDDPTITVSGLTSSPYNFVGGAWSATNILDDTYTVSQLLNDDDETGTGTVNVSGASEASSGNIAASDSSATFAVDTTNPTILSSTASVDPITDGGLNQTVVVVYDSTMDNTDDPTITVSGLTSSPYNFVGGAWSATNILDDTYTVSQLLNDDDETGTGTVNVSGASEASSGNIAASDSSATFAVDTTNPTTTLAPANGSSGVSTTTNVVVTFSEPVVTGTFAYSLLPNPGGTATVWSGGNTIATISHNAFSQNTSYTFTVTGGDDVSGNSTAGSAATFTTAAGGGSARQGCTDPSATNYDSAAIVDNGTCVLPQPVVTYGGGSGGAGVVTPVATVAPTHPAQEETVSGCMDSYATNYNSKATTDDGSCKLSIAARLRKARDVKAAITANVTAIVKLPAAKRVNAVLAAFQARPRRGHAAAGAEAGTGIVGINRATLRANADARRAAAQEQQSVQEKTVLSEIFTRPLSVKSTGPDVVWAKRLLKDRGFWLGDINDVYTPEFALAVEASQRVEGVIATGIIGNYTGNLMDEALNDADYRADLERRFP